MPTYKSKRFADIQRLLEAGDNKNKGPVNYGETGEAVEVIQQTLLDLGYKLPRYGRDGVYGDETERAVQQLEAKYGLGVDRGTAGQKVLAKLDELAAAANLGPIKPVKIATLDKNILWSKKAVEYVLTTVGLKAPNWDKYRGDPSWERGTGPKDALDVCLYDKTRPDTEAAYAGLGSAAAPIDWVRLVAEGAKKNKCGNCGENSALAFMWLYDQGVRPIDWMNLAEADHAFVVIGRKPGKATDWKGWGPDAVVCDPWGQGFRYGDKMTGTYSAKIFGPQMGGMVPFTKVVSDFRAG
jgi:peptidoglycan hydrolase-like protein with peptidoglycan-binding domain